MEIIDFFRKKNAVKKQKNSFSTIWFYRTYQTDCFVKTDVNPFNRSILLISQSDKPENSKKCFCPVHFKWERIISEDDKSVITTSCVLEGLKESYKKSQAIYTRYLPYHENSYLYNKLEDGEISVEDLEPEELRECIYEYKENCSRKLEEEEIKKYNSKVNLELKNRNISNGDVLFYKVQLDVNNQILLLTQYSVNRPMMEKYFPYMTHEITEVPFLKIREEYNIKSGKYRQLFNEGSGFDISAGCVNSFYYTDEIYEYCSALLKKEINRLFSRTINYPEYKPSNLESINPYSDDNKKIRNDTTINGEQMQALIAFPYDPPLYFALKYLEKYEFIKNYDEEKLRTDTNCYQNLCKSLDFISNKTLRKMYLKNQSVLYSFRILENAGFKDINIINSILEIPEIHYFLYREEEDLTFFMKWAIPLKGEKPAWNLINKDLLPDREVWNIGIKVTDSLYMFRQYFENLDYETRKAILKDGFNRYNHDLLSNIGIKLKNQNIDFSYTEKERALEDDIDGYNFRLPKDYYQLVDVATVLHNCAASYRERILHKDCIVMYAQKDNQYVFCIEVRNNNMVHQQRTDRNGNPTGSEAEILKQWREKHQLQFQGNRY